MANDASIALQSTIPAQQNPLAVIGALSQLKETQARIALQNAQIQTANANTADIVEQAAQRRRANESQTKLASALADPDVHTAIKNGDLSALYKTGADPASINTVSEGLNKFYQSAGTLHDADVARHAAGRDALTKALTNIDPKAENAAAQLNSFKTTIAKDYPDLARQLPDFTSGPQLAQQIDDVKKSNGIFSAVLNSELATRENRQKIDTSAAEAGKATAETDKFKQDVATAQANLPKVQADAEVARLEADFKKTHGGKSPAEVETGRHNQRDESLKAGELDIKKKTFDATLGAGLDANGKPLSPEEFKRLAEQDPVAKAVAEYRVKGPPVQTRGGVVSPELKKILAINPSYDDTTFPARSKTAADFSPAGASGKEITAADTALTHLNALSEAGAALKNNDIQKLNQLANFLGAQTGGSAKGTYDTIVNMVAPEISKAVIGAAGGEHEREATAVNYGSNLSDAQRESNIAATVGLLGARFDKRAHAYESEMGHPLPRTLSPESQAIRQKYTKQPSGVVQPIALKDGTFLTPHDAAAADRFRKDHPYLIK